MLICKTVDTERRFLESQSDLSDHNEESIEISLLKYEAVVEK